MHILRPYVRICHFLSRLVFLHAAHMPARPLPLSCCANPYSTHPVAPAPHPAPHSHPKFHPDQSHNHRCHQLLTSLSPAGSAPHSCGPAECRLQADTLLPHLTCADGAPWCRASYRVRRCAGATLMWSISTIMICAGPSVSAKSQTPLPEVRAPHR